MMRDAYPFEEVALMGGRIMERLSHGLSGLRCAEKVFVFEVVSRGNGLTMMVW